MHWEEVGPHRLGHGDCRPGLAELRPMSVHLVFSSPPYAFGKEYEDDDEHALEELLVEVAEALYRVLMPTGFCVMNFPIATRFDEMPEEMYNRVFCKRNKFILHSRRIWAKPIATLTGPKSGIHLSVPFAEAENLFTFRKPPNKKEPDIYRKLASRGIWYTPPGATQEKKVPRVKHPAMFPLELPIMGIRTWSKIGDVVLDPFGGMFTTVLAAHHEGRKGISFEIMPKQPGDPEYFEYGLERVRRVVNQLTFPSIDPEALMDDSEMRLPATWQNVTSKKRSRRR